MELGLTGKVAIITGASKGIGAGIAKYLAAEGVKVVINYATAKADADRVVAEITTNGGEAMAVQADVSKEADVVRLFEAVGKVDIVVNNAGVYQFALLGDVTEEFFRRQVDINLLGPLLMMREALKYFPEGGGSIVNVSSVAAKKPTPAGSVYAGTKAALDAMTVALSQELAGRKIRVNSVLVGPTNTEGAQGLMVPEMVAQIEGLTPMKRLGIPADIAPVVAFLVSEAAGWVTGDRVLVSGGLQ